MLRFSLHLFKKGLRIFFLFYLPNLRFLIKKQLQYAKVPNCQQKILLRGEGKIQMGSNCSFGYILGGFNKYGTIEIQPRYLNSTIIIGPNVSTNNNIFLCAANYIKIGEDTLIGQNVVIMDFEAHGVSPATRRKIGEIGKVIIGNNVWIGNNVTILKNSEIGNNSIIAAGAVVSSTFPCNVIIGGVPAKIIKAL